MSTSIKFNVETSADADRAARIMVHVADEYADAGESTETTAPAKPATRGRGRPPKATEPAATVVPQPEGAKATVVDTTAATVVVPDPVTTTEPAVTAPTTPTPPADGKPELLVKMRAIALAKGTAWLRPVFKEHGVEKLSDMPEDAMRKTVAGFTAEEMREFLNPPKDE